MIKLLLLSTALVALSTAHLSAQSAGGSLELAGKVVDASGAQKALQESFISGMDSMLNQFKKQPGGEELARKVIDVAKEFFNDHYKWEFLRPLYAKGYAEQFNDDDLKALLAFYETPAGKKLADKGSTILQDVNRQVTARLQNQMPLLQSKMMQVVKEHLEKQPAAK